MDTLKTLQAFVRDDVTAGRIDPAPDENLLRHGALDSMGLLKLVAFLEETWSIEVADEDIVPENFGTLERLHAYVERKGAKG